MKKQLPVILLAIACIGLLAGCTTNPKPETAWEYKLMSDRDVQSYGVPPGEPYPMAIPTERMEECFQDLGKDGWEYVGVFETRGGENHVSVFKRPSNNRN